MIRAELATGEPADSEPAVEAQGLTVRLGTARAARTILQSVNG
jgi:hypothetical protein